MNTNFEQYAKYYNLLYSNKDYAKESSYVLKLIEQFSSNAKSILDLGCGTGGHAFEWAKKGFEVTGIDISEDMLAAAHSKLSREGLNNLRFEQGDIRTARTENNYDVVTAMFHVMGYQTSNKDFLAALKTARIHVKDDGLFVFDFWYGPAVLSDRPYNRDLEMEDDAISVKRKTTPEMLINENVVEVKFDVEIKDKQTGAIDHLHESHLMRYLFLPELEQMLDQTDWKIEKFEAFISGVVPSDKTWYATIIAAPK